MENFKVEMKNHFEMSDLGLMTHFLGIEVLQSRQGIFTCQENYIKKVLEKFGMENCKKVETPLAADMKIMKEDVAEKINPTTYRILIGCLLYITATRPDILFATSVLSRYMSSRSALHFKIAKRVLRYLKGTANLGMLYEKSHDNKFVDYCDSDWGGCLDDMKSTSSYIFQLGKCVISQSCKKQEIVAQSTAEAEYVSCSAVVNQAVWMRKLLFDLMQIQEEPTVIWCDNQSAVLMTKILCSMVVQNI